MIAIVSIYTYDDTDERENAMDPQNIRPSILKSVSREEFDKLVSRPEDSIVAALKQGEVDRRVAEAEVRPPTIEPNRRFA